LISERTDCRGADVEMAVFLCICEMHAYMRVSTD
jgi:hypothetical protein